MKLTYIQESVNEIIEKLHMQEGDVDVKDFKLVKSNLDNSYEVNISFTRKNDDGICSIAVYFN